MNKKKIILLIAIVIAFFLFFYFDLHTEFDLKIFKEQYLGKILEYRSESPVLTSLMFFTPCTL